MRKLFALSSVALVALTLTVSGCAKKEEAAAPAGSEATTPATTTPAPTSTAPAESSMGGAAKTDTTSHM